MSKPKTDGVETTRPSSEDGGALPQHEANSPVTTLSSGLRSMNFLHVMNPLETDNFISQRFTNYVMPANADTVSSSPSRPSDIIIAIRSARVDPVALIKTLTSRGSNIARRTASFIARTPSTVSAETSASDTCTDSGNGRDDTSSHNSGVVDEMSVLSRPELCYDDTDSDEEFSMYDYSDDFSSYQNNDETDIDICRNGGHQSTGSSDGDPSAIEFQLSISFQGRKYNATRAFPTFVKLREDLLHELKGNDRRSKRNGLTKCPGDLLDDNSVPELPRVLPESLGHGGYALSGVARSGFALLQSIAQHYCPEMEVWMRQVAEAFPCSQSLSRFLWEPLSSSSQGWETKDSCNDVGQTEKISPLTAFAKPSLQTRSKPKPSNFSKAPRFKTVGSVGSLDSIQEGDINECDDDMGEDW